MNQLLIPFGEISLLFDGVSIEYNAIELNKDDVLFPDVSGRYKIVFKYESDNANHSLACVINGIDLNIIDFGPESGERLEAQAFYGDSSKLTIGAEGDSYYLNGVRFGEYDYDVSSLDNGIEYNILPATKSNDFVFGVSWITPYNEKNDVQTWYGADPTYM